MRKKIAALNLCFGLLALATRLWAIDAAESKTIPKWYAVAVGGLNLRDKPAMTGKKLAVIPFGTELEATGNEVMNYQKADYWTEVRYKDQTGWVSNKLLNTQALPENPAGDFDWRGKIFYNAPSHWKPGHGSTLDEAHGLTSYNVKGVQYLTFEKMNRRIGQFPEWTIVDFLRIEKPKDHVGIGAGECTDSNGQSVSIDVSKELPGRKRVDNTEQFRLSQAWVADIKQGRFVPFPVQGVVCKINIMD